MVKQLLNMDGDIEALDVAIFACVVTYWLRRKSLGDAPNAPFQLAM